jgi:molecular chaperone GrpE
MRVNPQAFACAEGGNRLTKESQDTVGNIELDQDETDSLTQTTEDGQQQNESQKVSERGEPEAGEAVDKCSAEMESLRQQMLRVHADFDNFRKRSRQEKEDLQQFATKKLLLDLLPVTDNFERALSSLEAASSVDEVKTGLDMVHRQLLQILQQYGVEVMNPVDKPFNPNLHDAVMQEAEDGKEAGVVSQVLQKGYMLHDKVLRPAMVKVTV